MNTPICDFVNQYAKSDSVRLHMPGHKGKSFFGCERYDITEIDGADSLYAADGIIYESERNASLLFGTRATLYSTEGSSQCIRAMLYLALLSFKMKHRGIRPVVIAARNAHKAFLTAAALLDFDIEWLFPENNDYSLCRCEISAKQLERTIDNTENIACVYVTSPDYLGNCLDISRLAGVSHKKGLPLLVDNAHGAYLRFLTDCAHPIALGADICCDSAHKTLPSLTGGAYLHISASAPAVFYEKARTAMALFGSTSPSYLILQSLDRVNKYIADGYSSRLEATVNKVVTLKARLYENGWRFAGSEPLKLTLDARKYGYTGDLVAGELQQHGIICEYADRDYVVFMLTPEVTDDELKRLETALMRFEKRQPIAVNHPEFQKPELAISVREALFMPSETVDVGNAVGRIVASLAVSCPPAIAPAVPGERINESTAYYFKYYNVDTISVACEAKK